MTLYLPYTFVGGTAAKAQEVNANFQQTKKYIEDLETTYANYGSLISNLQANKANINGSSSQYFFVANPTYAGASQGDAAVPLYYMKNYSSWLNYLIAGMHITIVDDDSFSIGLGGCGDSTGQYIIRNNQTFTTDNYSGLTANTTYAVWVKASSVASEPSVSGVYLTGVSSSPSIVENEIIRRIGYITTDSNAHFTSARKEDY